MYLLLRNNKQSGPYSLEELKSMGLKAYDLVWLEGKSAAWRYSSEIEELKPFAPIVEEQPFDRFYRRPASAPTNNTTTNTAGTTLDASPSIANAPVPVSVESSKAPGKRIIYVTMPAARNATVTAPQSNPSRGETPRESQPVGSSVAHAIEDYTAHHTGDRTIIEEFFPHKKRSSRVIRLLTIAICILALLAAGFIIGLNMNKETLGFPSRVVAKVPPANHNLLPGNPNLPSGSLDQTIVHPTAEHLPVSAATTPALTGDQARSTGTVPTVVEQPNAMSPTVARTRLRPSPMTPGFKTQKERSAHAMSRANSLSAAKDSAASALANAIHRADVAEPYHNNQELADKEAVKAALASQVSVGANGYSVGTFGGITDLQLTVTNRSVYPLDLVIVEVQYIQANKKIYKTENLYFRGIAAGSALMEEAPKSSRGVHVQYKIMTITSKEVAYSYSGI